MATIVQWAATILSLVGAVVFNIKKSRWRFAIWAIACVIWIAWGYGDVG